MYGSMVVSISLPALFLVAVAVTVASLLGTGSFFGVVAFVFVGVAAFVGAVFVGGAALIAGAFFGADVSESSFTAAIDLAEADVKSFCVGALNKMEDRSDFLLAKLHFQLLTFP